MIIFFGPAGAGKSVQGQILAARMGWRWLSAGQLLRDTKDAELLAQMHTGELADSATVSRVMGDALARAEGIDKVILDGFPRELRQAQWLVENQPQHGRAVALVIVIDLDHAEILKRLTIRGRADDTPDAIDQRLEIYKEEISPILEYFEGQQVPIAHISGNGTVGEVHDSIYEELNARGIV